MINKYFDEPIEENDLFYICFLIEKVSRHLHQRNQYVVNQLGYDNLYHLISVANVLHSENSDQVFYDVIVLLIIRTIQMEVVGLYLIGSLILCTLFTKLIFYRIYK